MIVRYVVLLYPFGDFVVPIILDITPQLAGATGPCVFFWSTTLQPSLTEVDIAIGQFWKLLKDKQASETDRPSKASLEDCLGEERSAVGYRGYVGVLPGQCGSDPTAAKTLRIHDESTWRGDSRKRGSAL